MNFAGSESMTLSVFTAVKGPPFTCAISNIDVLPAPQKLQLSRLLDFLGYIVLNYIRRKCQYVDGFQSTVIAYHFPFPRSFLYVETPMTLGGIDRHYILLVIPIDRINPTWAISWSRYHFSPHVGTSNPACGSGTTPMFAAPGMALTENPF